MNMEEDDELHSIDVLRIHGGDSDGGAERIACFIARGKPVEWLPDDSTNPL